MDSITGGLIWNKVTKVLMIEWPNESCRTDIKIVRSTCKALRQATDDHLACPFPIIITTTNVELGRYASRLLPSVASIEVHLSSLDARDSIKVAIRMPINLEILPDFMFVLPIYRMKPQIRERVTCLTISGALNKGLMAAFDKLIKLLPNIRQLDLSEAHLVDDNSERRGLYSALAYLPCLKELRLNHIHDLDGIGILATIENLRKRAELCKIETSSSSRWPRLLDFPPHIKTPISRLQALVRLCVNGSNVDLSRRFDVNGAHGDDGEDNDEHEDLESDNGGDGKFVCGGPPANGEDGCRACAMARALGGSFPFAPMSFQ